MLPDKAIGKLLRKARKAKRLTIEDLVVKLGGDTSSATISRLENGKAPLRETERLLEICDALDIPKEEILK